MIRSIVIPYAKKLVKSADGAAKKVPALKTQFNACKDSYYLIVMFLKSSASELKLDPLTANYDAMAMTVHMDKLIPLAIGANLIVGG